MLFNSFGIQPPKPAKTKLIRYMIQAGHLLVMSRVRTSFIGVKFPITQFRKPGPYATSSGPPCITSYHLCSPEPTKQNSLGCSIQGAGSSISKANYWIYQFWPIFEARAMLVFPTLTLGSWNHQLDSTHCLFQNFNTPRDPGSPKLRMVSWNLDTIRFVSVVGHPQSYDPMDA